MAMASLNRLRVLVAATLAIAAAFANATPSAHAVNLAELSGYWSGMGTVTMTSGATEQLRCVATYKPADKGFLQNLRCASTGYSISAAVALKVAGSDVTGTWEEKTYSANGDITGRMTDSGFVLAIKGTNFNANLNLKHSACKQAIDIVPTGADVTRIKIGLGKC